MIEIEVERIFKEIQAIEAVLLKNPEPSDIDSFRNSSSKHLLMASASYFERLVCDTIIHHCQSKAPSDTVVNFIQKQALDRKYHTLFDWRANNVNQFFRLFGTGFSNWISNNIQDEISEGIKEFIYIGSMRNQLVHNNYATFNIDDTYNDIWNKFQKALRFVEWLPEQFTLYDNEVNEAKD